MPVTGSVNDQNQLIVCVPIRESSCYIASLPPYSLKDYSGLLGSISSNSLVKIDTIGHTKENKPLEIIRIGNPEAPNSVFVRARAHSFECGGSWGVEGLIKRMMLSGSEKYWSNFCLYILAMANKDMVSRGMSRYNTSGFDLNRNLDSKADSVNVPENYAMEKWLTSFIKSGKKIDLALDFHNDRNGCRIGLFQKDAAFLQSFK
jgi:murein tripeptide amidase MpaA